MGGNPSSGVAGRIRKRKSRGQGLRTRTGCIVCRKKHIKCDEEKPTCGLCERIGQDCVYEQLSTKTSASSCSPTPQPSVAQREADASKAQYIDASPQVQKDFRSTQNYAPPLEELPHARIVGSENSALDLTRRDSIASPENTYVQTMGSSSMSYHSGPSPNSCDDSARSVVSIGPVIDVAIANWFGLLAGDAALENNRLLDAEGEGAFFQSILPNPDEQQYGSVSPRQLSFVHRGTQAPRTSERMDDQNTCNESRSNRTDTNDQEEISLDNKLWQSSQILKLQVHEMLYFDNFVNRVSHWIDLFDPMRQFSTFVPHLALHNIGLLKAILALSVRHLSLSPCDTYGTPPVREDALQYYYETLQYVQKAMQFDSYNTSLELLATCLIISAYEMLDGSRGDWERHLKGVFLIQRSQVIHGDSQGLRSAVWWAWLCQDVWAAFRERRKAFTFWKPARTFQELSAHELASRSVYIMAQMVNYCSQQEIEAGKRNFEVRIRRAKELLATLDEWHASLTVEFAPLPLRANSFEEDVTPIWIHPPSFAVALLVYYAARVLLLVHRPSIGGLTGFMEQQTELTKNVDLICGIATNLTDSASSIMSSQCLFIAGMCTQDHKRRDGILRLLKSCRDRTGWPVKPLSEDLEAIWNNSGQI